MQRVVSWLLGLRTDASDVHRIVLPMYKLGCEWWEIQSEAEKARRRLSTESEP